MGELHSTTVSVNMISEGTSIKGQVNTKNDFRIAGVMDGQLEVKGKCIITESGKVTGDLVAHDADISGKVEGAVLTANKLVLRSTARIEGDIYTKTILMEEGAVFQGECRMGSDPMAARSTKRGNNSSRNGQQQPSGPAATTGATASANNKTPEKQTANQKKS